MDIKKIDIKGNAPPQGYNSLEKIRGALYHWISVPFKGEPIWCVLKCLSYMELKSCGNVSALYTPKESEKEKALNIDEIINIKNVQEAVCKLAFVKPSYDKIIGVITDTDFSVSEKQRELSEINKQVKLLKGKERREAEKRSLQIEYQIGFLLPDDTMSFVTAWSLGVEVTDIKKISRDILLDAAIMAKHWNKKPSEMITGVFTDFDRDSIDRQGMVLYQQHVEDMKRQQELKKNKYNWKGR